MVASERVSVDEQTNLWTQWTLLQNYRRRISLQKKTSTQEHIGDTVEWVSEWPHKMFFFNLIKIVTHDKWKNYVIVA